MTITEAAQIVREKDWLDAWREHVGDRGRDAEAAAAEQYARDAMADAPSEDDMLDGAYFHFYGVERDA